MHIAIPQMMSIMTYTLCRPKKGYLRNLIYAYGYDIAAVNFSGHDTCKTCLKYAKDISRDDWKAAQEVCRQKEWEKFNIRINSEDI